MRRYSVKRAFEEKSLAGQGFSVKREVITCKQGTSEVTKGKQSKQIPSQLKVDYEE
jgi:hypothetical protein